MKAIIAVNNLGFIGLGNKMLWYSKDDLAHFKTMTANSTVLVGFRTASELPQLKNRKVLIDDRSGLNTTDDIDWCIGGKKTYEKYAHLFTELHISHVNNNTTGDVMMPNFANLNPQCKIFKYYFESSTAN